MSAIGRNRNSVPSNAPRPTLVKQTADMLQKAILSRHQPGDRLQTVEELSAGFKVSRTVIREAIGILSTRGLIDVRHGDGTYVRAPQPSDLRDLLSIQVHFAARDNRILYVALMELRQIVESAATRLAATRALPDEVAEISRIWERGRSAAASGDMERKADADIEFHSAIIRASHNVMLSLIMDAISPLLRELRTVLVERPDRDEMTTSRHSGILEAIVARDADAAEREAANHTDLVNALLLRRLFGIADSGLVDGPDEH